MNRGTSQCNCQHIVILLPCHCSPIEYKFGTSAAAGAILILPHGAMSTQLSSPERFREVARARALDWYEFARERNGGQHLDRSLYLITGFYKAPSWSLGSFNDPDASAGEIIVEKGKDDPNIRLLRFSFTGDRRHSLGGNGVNQTIFICGFKIAVKSWLPAPVVMKATEPQTALSSLVYSFKDCLGRSRGFSGDHKPPTVISKF